MINIEQLQDDILKFLNDPGCTVPPLAAVLIERCDEAIQQLTTRITAERARGNLLQEALDEENPPKWGMVGGKQPLKEDKA